MGWSSVTCSCGKLREETRFCVRLAGETMRCESFGHVIGRRTRHSGPFTSGGRMWRTCRGANTGKCRSTERVRRDTFRRDGRVSPAPAESSDVTTDSSFLVSCCWCFQAVNVGRKKRETERKVWVFVVSPSATCVTSPGRRAERERTTLIWITHASERTVSLTPGVSRDRAVQTDHGTACHTGSGSACRCGILFQVNPNLLVWSSTFQRHAVVSGRRHIKARLLVWRPTSDLSVLWPCRERFPLFLPFPPAIPAGGVQSTASATAATPAAPSLLTISPSLILLSVTTRRTTFLITCRGQKHVRRGEEKRRERRGRDG